MSEKLELPQIVNVKNTYIKNLSLARIRGVDINTDSLSTETVPVLDDILTKAFATGADTVSVWPYDTIVVGEDKPYSRKHVIYKKISDNVLAFPIIDNKHPFFTREMKYKKESK